MKARGSTGLVIPFGLVSGGAILIYAGLNGKTIIEALRGLPGTLANTPYEADARAAVGALASLRGGTGGGGGGGGAALSGGPKGYPLGQKGNIIGTPYSGTHTLGNWESDNAIDISIPMGTPVVAVASGVITQTGGQASLAGRFGGFSLHLKTRDNEYFYTHLKKLKVKEGQKVRAGQVIGISGSANGVPHLHFGVKNGDPRTLGKIRSKPKKRGISTPKKVR